MIDVEKYTAILNWFVKGSGHPGYEGFVPSNECSQPESIREKDSENNTDHSENLEIKISL